MYLNFCRALYIADCNVESTKNDCKYVITFREKKLDLGVTDFKKLTFSKRDFASFTNQDELYIKKRVLNDKLLLYGWTLYLNFKEMCLIMIKDIKRLNKIIQKRKTVFYSFKQCDLWPTNGTFLENVKNILKQIVIFSVFSSDLLYKKNLVL